MKQFIKKYFERKAKVRTIKLASKVDCNGEKITTVAKEIYNWIKE